MHKDKPVIISCGFNGWYPNGVDRLKQSLQTHGWTGDTLFFKDYPPNCPYTHAESPYFFKIAAFQEAIRQGYRTILWLDASFYAIKKPDPIFEIIQDQGFYLFKTGYNLAQSVNDRALDMAYLTRNEAEQATEYASGCVGLNLEDPLAQRIFKDWSLLMRCGLNRGGRDHDGGSTDPRFLHHRQDQSCLSLAMHRSNLSTDSGLHYISYQEQLQSKENVIFIIHGM